MAGTQDLENQLATNTANIINLDKDMSQMSQDLRDHDIKDDKRFKEVTTRLEELGLANAKWLGVVAAIVGIVMVLNLLVSVYGAVHK